MTATSRDGAWLVNAENEDLARIDWRQVIDQFASYDERGLMIVGAERRVVAMSPRAREMLGYRETLPASLSNVLHDINIGFAVGEALHDRRAVEHESYLPDPDRLLRFRCVPILSDTGVPVFVVMSVDDVTRLRHLETVRRDFVANVSHELRTPLASIMLLVETLENGALDDPDASRHFLHRIQVESESMRRLVEELLELSRLESGRLSLELTPVPIDDVLDDVVNRLAPAAQAKRVDVQLDLQDPLPPAMADCERLTQVLMNLVHNGIKFTPDDGTVVIRARQQGRGILIEVADTGVGMSSEEAARVFERFYKVDKGRSRSGGSGLGLAIAQHLLQLHGTRLTVVSEVGRGSRFSFALPIAS